MITISAREQDSPELSACIRQRLRQADSHRVVIAMPGYPSPSYETVAALAQKICIATEGKELYLCFEHDMAKALGHCLCLTERPPKGCLCIDRLKLGSGSFLDIGEPVGPALPVVIKTLILSKEG